MKEELFRELCSQGCEQLEIGGSNVPALVSTCTDEQAVMVGGILTKANYVARVCAFDIAPTFPAELPGKVIRYNAGEYRILQAKKHPRSDIVHLFISQK